MEIGDKVQPNHSVIKPGFELGYVRDLWTNTNGRGVQTEMAYVYWPGIRGCGDWPVSHLSSAVE